jgi:hypothetical protein
MGGQESQPRLATLQYSILDARRTTPGVQRCEGLSKAVESSPRATRRSAHHEPLEEPPRMSAMSFHEFRQLLPQHFPLLMVDRVVDHECGVRLVGVENVGGNDTALHDMVRARSEDRRAAPRGRLAVAGVLPTIQMGTRCPDPRVRAHGVRCAR